MFLGVFSSIVSQQQTGTPPASPLDVSSSDVGGGIELLTRIALGAVETVSSLDASISIQLSAAETATGVDASNRIDTNPFSADTGSGTETAASISLSAADTGSATTESTLIAISIISADTGAGVDAGANLRLSSSEIGSAAETAALSVHLSAAETGSGIDAGSVNAGGSIHGKDISPSNVGYTAYFDTGLGRNLVLGDLTVISGSHIASDFISAGGLMEKKNFTGDLRVDVNNATFRACRFSETAWNFLNGVHASGTTFEWCSIDTEVVQDEALKFQGYHAFRCSLTGSSDGVKANGASTILEECYIRTKGTTGDHNDGVQNVGGDGSISILRCNIDGSPVNGIGGPNSAVFSADSTSSTVMDMTIEDCLLACAGTAGGIIGLFDGGLTPNITYTVTGCYFVRGPIAMSRGTTGTTPLNQITWSNNVWSDDLSSIPLS